jgi:hypothetical protein
MDDIDADGRETELGQHDRWMRQAPDLYTRYMELLSARDEAKRELSEIVALTAGRVNNTSVKHRVARHAKQALIALEAT